MELKNILPRGNEVPRRGIILVCGNVNNGTELLLREAEKRGCVYGVECQSLAGIAKMLTEENFTAQQQSEGVRTVEAGAFLLYDVVRRHAARLPYDPAGYPTPKAFREHLDRILTVNTARELLRIIHLIRMNDRREQLRAMSRNNYRLQRLLAVTDLYENALLERGLYDIPRLLQTAVRFLRERKQQGIPCFAQAYDYYVLDDFTPDALEQELLTLLGAGGEPVTVPEGKGVTHRFVSAYGMADELRFCAKDIIERKVHPGDAVLYYTAAAYEPLIRSVFAAENIPVCFPSGTCAAESDCFLLVMDLLDWVRSNYRLDRLRTILFEPALAFLFSQGNFVTRLSKGAIDRYLLRAGYLFGRDCYRALAKAAERAPVLHPDSEGKLNQEESDALIAYMTGRFIDELLTLTLPDKDDRYDIHAFLGRLLTFLEHNSEPAGPKQPELAALRELLQNLRTLTGSGMLLTLDETFDYLSNAVSNTAIGMKHSSDCVSACLLESHRLLSSRKNQYLLGLSSDLMLRSTNESPVLYDRELSALLEGLPRPLIEGCLGETINVVHRRTAEGLIHSLPDGCTLTFSYPTYDQSRLYQRSKTDLYEKYESAGPPAIHYNTLDPRSRHFLYETVTPPPEMEEETVENIVDFLLKEQQLSRSKKQSKPGATPPQQEKPGQEPFLTEQETEEGSFLTEQEPGQEPLPTEQEPGQEPFLTEQESKEEPLPTEQEPGQEPLAGTFSPGDEELEELRKGAQFPERKELSVSATSLHTLLNCPMLYALKYHYGVREEPVLDPARTEWLDGSRKGLFFHSLMEYYLTESFSLGKKGTITPPDGRCPDFDPRLYDRVFQRVLQSYEYLPVPVQKVKEEQKQEIYDRGKACLTGLLSDMKAGDPYRPCAMEYQWPKPKEPEIVSLPSLGEGHQNSPTAVSLRLEKGMMDRLDCYTDKEGTVHYRIVDYKTGRLDSFLEEYRDRLVQHYVYCQGLRSSLPKEGCVIDSFVFVFPFEEQSSVYTYRGGSFVYQREGRGFSRIEITGDDLFALSEGAKKLLARFAGGASDCFECYPTLARWLDPPGTQTRTATPCTYCKFGSLCGVTTEKEETSDE